MLLGLQHVQVPWATTPDPAGICRALLSTPEAQICRPFACTFVRSFIHQLRIRSGVEASPEDREMKAPWSGSPGALGLVQRGTCHENCDEEKNEVSWGIR